MVSIAKRPISRVALSVNRLTTATTAALAAGQSSQPDPKAISTASTAPATASQNQKPCAR